ncbi:MAG: hypothetical protein ACE5G0_09635, partial [Rhodothermales bacterium]
MFINQATLKTFLARLDAAFGHPGHLYLVGETTLVFEGWLSWTEHIAFTAEVAPEHRGAFDEAVRRVQQDAGLEVIDESPADVIPLPDGYTHRARPISHAPTTHLRLYHFDPYSVALRFIARGDEPDYRLVLTFLEHCWVEEDEMHVRLADVLPRFSLETIQQDPA